MSELRWSDEPQDVVASEFMKHKGYPDAHPYDVEKLDDQKCWYYLYSLDEGMLELEVSWEEATGWETYVTSFGLHEDWKH